MLSRGLIAVAVVVVAFVVYAFIARFALHGEVTPASLYTSVAARSGSESASSDIAGDRCRRRPERRAWRCVVLSSTASGADVVYRVRVGADSSCWRAGSTTGRRSGGLPERLDGCVRRWQWRLFGYL